MPANAAAWLMGNNVRPLEVNSAPYPSPTADQIVVKAHAVAINPIDWKKQMAGSLVYPWIKYPFVLGTDVAGEIVELGSDVRGFRVGNRVVGHAIGATQEENDFAQGTFQQYTILLDTMTSPIPESMSYEQASVLPLCLSTAAYGLFAKNQLALNRPSSSPKSTGKVLLVWSGSTSVGSNAIQLGKAAGYEVFTTASRKNFDYVRGIGAARSFDYKSKSVVSELITALRGRQLAGAISIGSGAADACFDILAKCQGNKFIFMATYPVPDVPPKYFAVPRTIFTYIF